MYPNVNITTASCSSRGRQIKAAWAHKANRIRLAVTQRKGCFSQVELRSGFLSLNLCCYWSNNWRQTQQKSNLICFKEEGELESICRLCIYEHRHIRMLMMSTLYLFASSGFYDIKQYFRRTENSCLSE